MEIFKLYIKDEKVDLPITSVKIKNSIKNYISQATLNLVNPEDVFGDVFNLSDAVKLELYHIEDEIYIKKLEGYVSSLNKKNEEMEVELTQYTGRMYERRVNEVYKHRTAYDILTNISELYLSEFTRNNINYDGEDFEDTIQEDTNGTILLDAVNIKYAQRITPTRENIVKIDLYVEDNSDGIADIQLRAEDTDLPSDNDILQRIENVKLVNGKNTINLTRKYLDVSKNYWICIIWKGGSFKLSKNGTSNTGRVAKSTANPESWGAENINDLKFTTYYTSAKIIETFKMPMKQVAECFEDVVKIMPDDWIYYIDNEGDIHWEREKFDTINFTFDNDNIFKITKNEEGRKIFNSITVNGGEEITTNSVDSFKGDGIQKTFSFSAGNPIKPLKKVTINGVLKIEDTDFIVDYPTKKIHFSVAPANNHEIHIKHDYSLPVIAKKYDMSSISKHGKRDLVKSDKNIESFERANEIADGLLNLYTTEENLISIEGFWFPQLDCGNYVSVDSSRLKVSGNYLISEIEFDMEKDIKTKLNLANEEIVSIPDVLKELKASIEEIQMEKQEKDVPAVENYDFSGEVNYTAEIEAFENYMCDSFILGHSGDNGKLNRGKILDLFDDVSNFSSGDFSLNSDTDSSNIKAGTMSLEVESDSVKTGYITSTNSYGDLSDYTGEDEGEASEGVIGLWVKCNNKNYLTDILMRVGSSNTDYIELNGGITGFKNSGWNYITFKMKNVSSTGNPNWKDVKYIRIELQTKAEVYYMNYLTIGKGNLIGLNGLGRRDIMRQVV